MGEGVCCYELSEKTGLPPTREKKKRKRAEWAPGCGDKRFSKCAVYISNYDNRSKEDKVARSWQAPRFISPAPCVARPVYTLLTVCQEK